MKPNKTLLNSQLKANNKSIPFTDVAVLIRGVSYLKKDVRAHRFPGSIGIFRANNIQNGKLNSEDLVYVPKAYVDSGQIVRENDIVLAMSSGSKDLVGKCAQSRINTENAFGAFCGLIRPSPWIEPKFLGYFLETPGYRRTISIVSRGVNINNLRREHIESLNIPFYSRPEQKRIVAKIESLFSRLDSAKDSLERVRVEIKRYRQSVLKSAFENLKQEEPIEKVFKIIDYRGRTPPYADKGIIHLRTSNIRDGQIRRENLRYVTEEIYKKYMTRGIPRKGDVLMTTEAPMGEVALIPQYKFSIAQRMILLRSDNLDKFVLYQIRSTAFQKKMKRAKTGTTVAGISSRNFKKVMFKLCSLQEQSKIVEKIESCFEQAKVLEDAVEQGLGKIEQLKQSILKKAFEGKLVEPDPNDEPVEVLLERIKKEKFKLSPVIQKESKRF